MKPRRYNYELTTWLLRRVAGVDRRSVRGVVESATGAVKFVNHGSQAIVRHGARCETCCTLEPTGSKVSEISDMAGRIAPA